MEGSDECAAHRGHLKDDLWKDGLLQGCLIFSQGNRWRSRCEAYLHCYILVIYIKYTCHCIEASWDKKIWKEKIFQKEHLLPPYVSSFYNMSLLNRNLKSGRGSRLRRLRNFYLHIRPVQSVPDAQPFFVVYAVLWYTFLYYPVGFQTVGSGRGRWEV